MVNFKIKLATKIILISCFDIYTKEYCKDYLVDDSLKENFSINLTKEDIIKEKELECNQGAYGSIELSALYRRIVTELAKYNIILFHCSSFEVDGKAFAIAAHSGVGKSTHVRILRKVFGEDRIKYINDDKPLLLFSKDSIEVFGTPWNGKERLSRNVSFPLKGIALLSRGETNSISLMDKKDAYQRIMEQVFLPRSKLEMISVLGMVDILLKEIPIYDLKANMSSYAAYCTYKGMIERK